MSHKPKITYRQALYGKEISRISRYYDRLIQLLPLEHDDGNMCSAIQCDKIETSKDIASMPDLSSEHKRRSIVFLNGNFNYEFDIEKLLKSLSVKLSRTSRILVLAYNPYYRFIYKIATVLGLRKGEMPSTFLTMANLVNIFRLSGFELVRIRPACYFPAKLFGIGKIINGVLPSVPFFKWFAFASIITIRPLKPSSADTSLSIIIPARNERGNIEKALIGLENIKHKPIQIIFVEGHSCDGTWDEIQRVKAKYKYQFEIQAFRQKGKGKADAVRLGFSKAKKELLTILDADLTMPPELILRFYEAYSSGVGDFINGSRMVYPQESKAMRFLNQLGNVFFGKALSFTLDTTVSDSLCGTKLFSRYDYQRFISWRRDFGDIDPFGDFELLFPSASLGIGIFNLPVRYRDRTYGATSISRFTHGWVLLKMTVHSLFRIKMSFG